MTTTQKKVWSEDPEFPPEVPVDVPPLETQVPPVPEEVQDFTPALLQPTQDPISSPVSQATPVPAAVPSPAPVPAQLTPTAEQSTTTRASSSKKRYKKTASRILQSSPSPAAVDLGSNSPSHPK
ncbi:uncharacterized protein C1orf198 homolog [Hibiscus syriacus]|uniref:uncharacterized protein C1orf198 homolog n=1 Tax=Hibiscus syriacus TaxID=106335 RepID=UPI0019226AFE|nr:uncharacterized protein C1orf198 homolog [Hibiscus syriacus]